MTEEHVSAPPPEPQTPPAAPALDTTRVSEAVRVSFAQRARAGAAPALRVGRAVLERPWTLTILTLFISAAFALGFDKLGSVFAITTSVHVRTEVATFELDPKLEYVWWVPAGRYSLLLQDAPAGCRHPSHFDTICDFAHPSAISIKNGGTVRLEALPPANDSGDSPRNGFGNDSPRAPADAPRLSISLTPSERPRDAARGASKFAIKEQSERSAIETTELLTFESVGVDVWRVPLRVQRAEIGEFVTESPDTTETLGLVRQPIMTEGSVRYFARWGSRYQIAEERFDPADVVQIPGDGRPGSLAGLISLAAASADDRDIFEITLHTGDTKVSVRRFGDDHSIGASAWSALSKLPIMIAAWAVFLSVVQVTNHHSARSGAIRSRKEHGKNHKP